MLLQPSKNWKYMMITEKYFKSQNAMDKRAKNIQLDLGLTLDFHH